MDWMVVTGLSGKYIGACSKIMKPKCDIGGEK